MLANGKIVSGWTGTLALLIFVALSTQGQQNVEQQTLMETAREIMSSARYCTLITINAGGAEARTMDPLPPEKDLTIWLATNPLSQKVNEIRKNPNVTLHYFNEASQAYVAVQGKARIVTDPSEKTKHWKEEWAPFYADRDKGLVMIAVTPVRLEVVNIAKGIVGDDKTWQPRVVNLRRGARR